MSRGKKHECIGMTLNFSAPGQVSVSLPKYVEEIIGVFEKAAPDELGTKSSTIYLFQDEDAEKLPPEKGKEFQNLVAKIFVCYQEDRRRTERSTTLCDGLYKWRQLCNGPYNWRYVHSGEDRNRSWVSGLRSRPVSLVFGTPPAWRHHRSVLEYCSKLV